MERCSKKLICVCLSSLLYASQTFAIDEAAFQRCVSTKDGTLAIASQADKGVTRDELKRRVTDAAFHGLIDFVYDFRGVKTNQEIAANMFERCLQNSANATGRPGKRR